MNQKWCELCGDLIVKNYVGVAPIILDEDLCGDCNNSITALIMGAFSDMAKVFAARPKSQDDALEMLFRVNQIFINTEKKLRKIHDRDKEMIELAVYAANKRREEVFNRALYGGSK